MSEHMLLLTADAEVRQVNPTDLNQWQQLVSPKGGIIDVIYTRDADEPTGLCLIVDQEALIHQATRPNALATLLAGYHLMGQYLTGDVLVCVVNDDPEGPDFLGLEDIEVRVLGLVAKAAKGAMFA